LVVHGRKLGVPLTDYEKYIRTEELLGLQKSPDALSCHDELQFQVVHQAHELYMKLIEHELRFACQLLETRDVARALTGLGRVTKVQRVLLASIDLLDTMAPTDYMTIRAGLGRGSGQESPGFRTMLRLPGEIVWPAMSAFLEREGTTLRQIYEHPHAHHQLFQLCEALLDYDQLLQTWRYRHLILVYRIIGTGTPSLKGKHSDLLLRGMQQRFFPKLWDIRDEVFGEWTAAQAAKGHDPGYHG
jgi:tryptophan 2,3-dioxygenase